MCGWQFAGMPPIWHALPLAVGYNRPFRNVSSNLRDALRSFIIIIIVIIIITIIIIVIIIIIIIMYLYLFVCLFILAHLCMLCMWFAKKVSYSLSPQTLLSRTRCLSYLGRKVMILVFDLYTARIHSHIGALIEGQKTNMERSQKLDKCQIQVN